MGRPAHDNSGRNPESADHREEMEPGAGDVPGSCGDSANGHPAPSFEGSANGSDAAGAIRARRAESASGAGALALRFSRDLEPISWGAESASQEPPRCCRKGLIRAGARLSPWAGGPSACRRHSAASPGSPDYCFVRRVKRCPRAERFLTDGETPLCLFGQAGRLWDRSALLLQASSLLQSAFGAKQGQTLAASGVIRHRSKGKNIRRAEQPEGPLPNGCSAPRASDP